MQGCEFNYYFFVNRLPLISIYYKTLEEVWFGSSANYTNLKISCCLTYALYMSNLQVMVGKCLLLGCVDGVKENSLWYFYLQSFKFLISRNVSFEDYAK